ncbi:MULTISPECIES: hypothetical protein [unclassified Lentimonas]|nr:MULTISPECIES: hypothetical protein [unclassified Lentimonas]
MKKALRISAVLNLVLIIGIFVIYQQKKEITPIRVNEAIPRVLIDEMLEPLKAKGYRLNRVSMVAIPENRSFETGSTVKIYLDDADGTPSKLIHVILDKSGWRIESESHIII